MGEGARPGRGGNNKIEGGEGVECCVFLSLEKHVSAWGVLHTHRTSLQNRRHLPSDECWEKGCACGGARGGGVITRLKGEKGMSVVSYCHSKYTKHITSPAHSHELCPAKQASPASDERWEKGHMRAEGGY